MHNSVAAFPGTTLRHRSRNLTLLLHGFRSPLTRIAGQPKHEYLRDPVICCRGCAGGGIAAWCLMRAQSGIPKCLPARSFAKTWFPLSAAPARSSPKPTSTSEPTSFGRITHLYVKEGDHVKKGADSGDRRERASQRPVSTPRRPASLRRHRYCLPTSPRKIRPKPPCSAQGRPGAEDARLAARRRPSIKPS